MLTLKKKEATNNKPGVEPLNNPKLNGEKKTDKNEMKTNASLSHNSFFVSTTVWKKVSVFKNDSLEWNRRENLIVYFQIKYVHVSNGFISSVWVFFCLRKVFSLN